MNTASTATPADTATAARLAHVQALRSMTEGPEPLSATVQRRLQDLWESGGGVDPATRPGRRPEYILLRPGFLHAPNDATGPALPRLVKSRGLQLRLLLLLLFDAQCRAEPGEQVRNVRRIARGADDRYPSWRELVLAETAPTTGTNRGASALRGRQIREALVVLERENLVAIHRRPGGRRDYNTFRLLSEASTAEEHPRYLVPENGIRIPRHFFINLWVFALTDTQLATYLLLAFLRHQFPSRHTEQGVFLTAEDREKIFRITRAAWRSTDLLHRYRLIDRMPTTQRNFRTGKVGDAKRKWANREIAPARFKINDGALEHPALDVIRQVLAEPAIEDHWRRETGQTLAGPLPE